MVTFGSFWDCLGGPCRPTRRQIVRDCSRIVQPVLHQPSCAHRVQHPWSSLCAPLLLLPAAAGIVGSSNPEGSNYKVFEAVAPAGSWTMVLKRAGHTTFMKPPTGVETWLLDRIFGGGEDSLGTGAVSNPVGCK